MSFLGVIAASDASGHVVGAERRSDIGLLIHHAEGDELLAQTMRMVAARRKAS